MSADIAAAWEHLKKATVTYPTARKRRGYKDSHWGMAEKLLFPPAPALPKPVPDYGLFSRSVAFVANPGAGYEGEKIGCLKQHGWMLALNCAMPGNDKWRIPAANLGVTVIPWMQVFKPDDVAELVQVACDWGSRGLVVNLEKESETTCRPAAVASELKAWAGWPADSVAILTSPYAEPDAGWLPLTGYVTASEAFLNANPANTPNMVYDHLASLGFTRTLACWGVGQWADAQLPVSPELYRAIDGHPSRPRWLWNIDQLDGDGIRAWLA